MRIENRPPRHYRWLTPGADTIGIPRDFQERYPEAYPAELEGFARAVLGGRPVAVGGADALAAYDLAVAADRSWRTGLPVRVNAGD